MRINLEYAVFPGSKITGPIGTKEENLLCVDGNRVLFLSGFLYGKSDQEIGKLLTQAMNRIILFQRDSGFKTVRVVNLLRTLSGASISPFPHDPELKGHILMENIKKAALDHVQTLNLG